MVAGRLHRPGPRLTVVLVVIASLAVLTPLAWTWRHPHAFQRSGGGLGVTGLEVGEPVYLGATYPADGAAGHVTLRGGHVDVATGADVVEAELLVCTLAPDAGVGAIGSYRGDDIHEDCAELVPVEGQRLDLQHQQGLRQQVVLELTLTRPGTVRITGVVLDYDQSWRRGSQRVRGEIVVTTRKVAP